MVAVLDHEVSVLVAHPKSLGPAAQLGEPRGKRVPHLVTDQRAYDPGGRYLQGDARRDIFPRSATSSVEHPPLSRRYARRCIRRPCQVFCR
jgi:hypothetical protein